MNVNGEYRIAVRPEAVWKALHDPAALYACVPGCEAVRQVADGVYEGRFAVEVGAVSTVYTGRATIGEAEFPHRYVVSAHVHSPTAGHADGVATVTLTPERGGTLVGYRARIDPAGRLAGVGERVLHGTAIRVANEFFTRLIERLQAEAARVAPLDQAAPGPHRQVVVVQPIAPAAPPLPSEPTTTQPPPPSLARATILAVGTSLWVLILALLLWPRG